MQVVIHIDKEIYEALKNGEVMISGLRSGKTFMAKIFTAVANGTPLPKGCGRLIDKDALGEKLHRYTEAPYQYALTVFNESPIIINADRSEDETYN